MNSQFMKNRKLYYKVCNDKSQSYVPQDYPLEYKIGETTYPRIKNSGIFVFESLKNLKMFLNREHRCFKNTVVLKGYGPKRKITPKYICFWCSDINDFWSNLKKNKSNRYVVSTSSIPPGTVLLKSFTPTEQINES